MTNQIDRKEFCPECRVFLDESRCCQICKKCLVDVDWDDEEMVECLSRGLLEEKDGYYDLTPKGIEALENFLKKNEESS